MQVLEIHSDFYLTYARKYVKIPRKGNDGERNEGVFTESRVWCEAVIRYRILMAPEQAARRTLSLGRHAGAALSAQGLGEPMSGALHNMSGTAGVFSLVSFVLRRRFFISKKQFM